MLSSVCFVGCLGTGDPVAPPDPAAPVFNSFGGDTIPCGEPVEITLWAGQDIDVGSVMVSIDGGTLCVAIQTTGGWVLTETHVAVATELDSIPQTGSGNPQVGQFLFQTEHNPPVTSFSYCTDPLDYLYEAGDVFIAVHARVELLDESGNPVQEETAWADGLPFPGRNWATYFTYFVEECTESEECALAVTYPNGGEELCVGFPYVLTWDYTGALPDQVRIELLRLGGDCLVIAESADNTGSYEWTAQSCGGEVEGYTIRVTSLGCGAVDESDGPFNIRTCGGGE
jgi:hypothetical protein